MIKKIQNQKINKKEEVDQKIQNLFEHSAEVLQMLDKNGKILYTSAAIKKMTGYTAEEIKGLNPFNFIHPQDVSLIKKKFIQLLATPGKHLSAQYRVKHKNGSWFWVETTGTNLLKHPGISAVVANVRSIHKQKILESELTQQAKLLTLAHDAFIVMDKKSIIEYWNKGAEKVYGYTQKQALGKTAYTLLKTKYPVSLKELIAYIKKNKTWQGELTHITKKGKKIVVESTWEIAGKDKILEVNKDITQAKFAEDKLKETNTQLSAIMENMSDAIAVYAKNGDMLFVNDNMAKYLGFSSAQKMKNVGNIKNLQEYLKRHFILSDEVGNIKSDFTDTPTAKVLQGEKFVFGTYNFHHKKTKKSVWLLNKTKIVETNNEKVVVHTLTDITDLKNAEDSIKFLSKASEILSSSLDYSTTLHKICTIAVPKIADWCAVDMMDANNTVNLVAIAHKDEKKVAWARKLRKKYPVSMKGNTGLAKVLKTGEPEFYPRITEEMIIHATNDAKIRRLIKRIGYSAAIIVPIKVKEKVIGALEFVSAESKRQYNNLDLQMAQQLASRVSVAIENSLLYQESQQERERLKSMVSNVPGVVWEAWGKPDKESQKIDFVSDYVETMLGYTVDEWLSTPNFWLNVVHPEDKQQVSQEAAEYFMRGRGGISRFRWVKKDGTAIWVEARSYIIKNSKGQSVGIRGVTMDITDRMELEQKKDDFISMASHELKTPLTSAGVLTQILVKRFEKKGDTQSLEILNKMNGSLDKLTELVRELLDVTRIQRGKLDFKKEKFLIGDLAKNIVANLQHISEHKLEIDWQTRELVYGDKDRIDQVLTNLITNAIKYSPEGKRVIIRSKKQDNEIVVSVQDFGIGIPKKQQGKIFDRFFQAGNSNGGGTYPGLGLGLFISSQIIKAHGGKMWVKSEEGKGATFYFSLPTFSRAQTLNLETPS